MAIQKPKTPAAPAFWLSAAVLGLIAALGPVSVDMYLPAFPSIVRDLGASVTDVQMTLIVFFAAIGVTQLFYGPISDQTGRKPALYAGLAVFALGSLGCALAPSIEWLSAARLVQGAGAGVMGAVPRAIVRDLHTGPDAARLMGFIMAVAAASPMFAPMAGSALMALAGWRLIFVCASAAGLAVFVLLKFKYPETLAAENRRAFSLVRMIKDCVFLLSERKFTGMALIGGFCLAGLFIFIANGPFVYADEYGLTPAEFSLAFAVNGAGFLLGAAAAGPAGRRMGQEPMVKAAAAAYAAAFAVLFALSTAGLAGLYVFAGLLFFGALCGGMIGPTVMVLAVDDHGGMAGLASSLGSSVQMIIGSLTAAVSSLFLNGTGAPMAAAMAAAAVCALVLAFWTAARPAPGA